MVYSHQECQSVCKVIIFFYLFINIRSHITSVQQIYTTNNGLKNEHIYLIILLTNLKHARTHARTHTHTEYRAGPPFAFRTALILRGTDSTRFGKHSSEILVHIDMIASRSCCRFVGCTSMMRMYRSTTSQRCFIGLRSGDCGGHLSKVNSLSCSRNQSEMIWALWHGALSCWK